MDPQLNTNMDHVKLILRDPWWKRDFFLNAADHLAPRPISLGLSDILQIVKTQTRPQLNSTQPNITLVKLDLKMTFVKIRAHKCAYEP